MSRFYFVDIETCPLPEEELVKLMPAHLASPIMPEEIKNPVMPEELSGDIPGFTPPTETELMDGCPAYKGKDHPEGDPVKKAAYRDKALAKAKASYESWLEKRNTKRKEWTETAERKQMAWEERAIDAKQKFIDDAALSAVTGSAKLIGIREHATGKNYIHIAGATPEQMKALNAVTYPKKTLFFFWKDEAEMLTAVSQGVNRGTVVPANDDNESPFRLIGYFTHLFDLPFLFRRAWITGATAPVMLRKGRYFNDAVSTDLHELWQLGDRQEKTGGMDGLAKILGTKRKSGTGESFHRLWQEDPVAAVLYLLDDLDVTEEAAEKMGVTYRPKESSAIPAKGK